MQKTNDRNLFLNNKFKKYYLIISIVICLFWVAISSILKLIGNNFLFNEVFFPYYNAMLIILLIVGMIIDEKIRKYPGIIVTLGTSIYCFSFIYMCTIDKNLTIPIVYIINIAISYIIFKYVYPKIIVIKNANKVFNTVYIIIVLSITLFIGMYYMI